MTGNLISLQPFLLALLIIFWTPVHIWSLAVFYREDYRKAGVPMLPVVERNDKVMWLIVLFTMLYIANAFAVFFMLKPLWVSLFMILLLNYPLVRLVVRSVRSSSTVVHYILFKLSGPHLGTVFTVYLALSIFMR
jgi:protoheme IX farnesyltransferase